MKKMLAVVVVIMWAAVSSVAAQQPQPERTPPAPQEVPNLRFDVSIVDEGGGAPMTRKNVSIIARGNNQTASVRSQGSLSPRDPIAVAMGPAGTHGVGIGLKVDVRGIHSAWAPGNSTPGKINGRVAVEYQPYSPEMKSLPSSVTTQVDAVFDEGRKMVIAQAADPLSDRKTTIEVTVTVLK
jgi:hypothetical protein